MLLKSVHHTLNPKSSVFLCLKPALVQAAGQVSWASRTVASVLPSAPSPGWDTPGVPRLLQTLVALGPQVRLDRMGSASHWVSICLC